MRTSVRPGAGSVVVVVMGAFLADFLLGAVSPVFPLLAKHLGASNRELAALITVGGLSSLSFVLPVARVADRADKHVVFSMGILLFGLASLDLATAHGFVSLGIAQLLLGVGLVSTFPVGLACVADARDGASRSVAVGWYTAAMGGGFALGPLVAGWSVGALGYRTTFTATGVLGVIGSVQVLLSLVSRRPMQGHLQPRSMADEARGSSPDATARPAPWPRREAVTASIANLPVSLAINVGILTFFPVYVASLGWSPALTGAVLFGRASFSSAARLTVRHVGKIPIDPLILIKASLLVESGVLALVAMSRTVIVLACLLVLEGVNYGVTVTLAQLTIVTGSVPRRSAASLVLFNASSGLATIIGGVLVVVLVGHHSSRSALLIVVACCLALSAVFFATDALGRRAVRAGARGRGPTQ